MRHTTITPELGSAESGRVGTAVHEVSHALAAKALGAKIKKIKVSAHEAFVDDDDSCSGFECMVVAVAGLVGESLWLHRHYGFSERRAFAHLEANDDPTDMNVARAEAKKCGRTIKEAKERARKILKPQRRKIERLALTLAQDGSLSPSKL